MRQPVNAFERLDVRDVLRPAGCALVRKQRGEPDDGDAASLHLEAEALADDFIEIFRRARVTVKRHCVAPDDGELGAGVAELDEQIAELDEELDCQG